jgi:tetratricopeptide (TPR) repeat protein
MGDGRFADVSWVSGFGFVEDGRGVVPIDWDGDGDLDLIFRNRTGPQLRFMRNDLPSANHYLALRLAGRTCNRDAIGARVEVTIPGGKLIRTVRAGGNYMAQGTRRLHFGLGETARIDGVHIVWPDGTHTAHPGLKPDTPYLITQGSEPVVDVSLRAVDGRRWAVETLKRPKASERTSVALLTPVPIPDLAIEGFDGGSKPLRSFAPNGPLLINLWQSNCPACLTELAGFVKERETLERSGVTILALTTDEPRDVPAARDILTQQSAWFPGGRANQELAPLAFLFKRIALERYDDLPLPTSLLVDAKGRLARLYLGPVEPAELVRDVSALAKDDEMGWLQRAVLRPGGIWQYPELMVRTEQLKRPKALVEQLLFERRYDLAYVYARDLVDRFDQYPPNEEFLQQTDDSLMHLAGGLDETDPRKAADVYRLILRDNPRHAEALLGLTEALMNVNTDEARVDAGRVFDEALMWLPSPQDPEQWLTRAQMLRRVGRSDDALLCVRRALEYDPENPELKSNLALALIDSGRKEEGLPLVDPAIDRLTSPVRLYLLGKALEDMGERERSTRCFERAVAASPSGPEEETALAYAALRLERFDRAAPLLTKLLEARPEDATARWNLGMALVSLGRLEEAVPHFQQALPYRNGSSDDQLVVGTALARLGRFEEAATHFRQAVQLKPDHLEALRSLGVAEDLLGNTTEAIGRYEAYLAVRAEDVRIMEKLGFAYQRVGRPVDAVRTYRAVLQVSPDYAPVKFHLAWILATVPDDKLRDGAAAVRLAEELEPAAPNHPGMLDVLAAAYAEAGRFDDAVRSATKAAEAARTQGDNALAEQILTRLTLYRDHKPFRAEP